MPPMLYRRFDVDSGYRFASYAVRQKLYLDPETGWLYPNTEIYEGGALQMRVNRYGCKGPDVDPAKPVIAVFGDSTAMGHALTPDSWPMHLGLDSHVVLNAAIEGANIARMLLRRAHLLEEVTPDVTVVYCGWHNLIYGETGEAYWDETLRRFLGSPITAFCTITSCLAPDFRTRGFTPLLHRDEVTSTVGAAADAAALDADFFNFWMDLEPSLETVNRLMDQIHAYNAVVRRLCRDTGAVLIDLDRAVTPVRYEDAPRDFYDVCHPRPRAYPKLGKVAGAALAPALEGRPVVSPRSVAQAPAASASEEQDLRRNVYPLW